MSIKLIVFDMAGTTVKDENSVTQTFKDALGEFGYQIPESVINPLMGYKKIVAITKMLHEYEADKSKITSVLISQIHDSFVEKMISFYEHASSLEALPHAESTMKTLKAAGIKIGINTGFSRNIAEVIISRLQWREKSVFDYLICSDEVAEGRPNAGMINRLRQMAGLGENDEVAKVGDTEVDVREGQNARCKYVVAVTTGAFTREELEPYEPTHIIDDLSELLSIIL
ncbi:HAD-IA family hydrolase [Pedobacter sp. PF22-3]|jgi:phosphonatase-like hydrolase|uniref:HAD-IA family hydrolase n=1 Tax=Pedobacter sp. PF22-3 TaxID=2994467 RepID=UPI002245526B|nr:HAD-IA family hydrolase [Pedobacter sp. PF22-3]MCX2492809.1 HAD-IA family hydrolase [Pedobacter sp. PF22-3]